VNSIANCIGFSPTMRTNPRKTSNILNVYVNPAPSKTEKPDNSHQSISPITKPAHQKINQPGKTVSPPTNNVSQLATIPNINPACKPRRRTNKTNGNGNAHTVSIPTSGTYIEMNNITAKTEARMAPSVNVLVSLTHPPHFFTF